MELHGPVSRIRDRILRQQVKGLIARNVFRPLRARRDGLKAKFANSKPADVKAKSIDTLRQVSALLQAKAPGDAAAFKSWLRQISQTTAEAASEGGGLLGFGGVQVSEAEKATLA
jgi:hypothetical protein